MFSWGPADPLRISFASGVTVLGGDPTLEQSPDQIPVDRPDIQIHDPVCPDIPEEGDMDISIAEPDVPIPVLQPPPGFLHFSWLREEWGPDGDPSLFDFSKELPGWFPWGFRGQSVDPPSLPISPIIHESLDESVVANVGSSRDELNTRLITFQRLLWRLYRSGWISCQTSLRTPRRPIFPDRYRCHRIVSLVGNWTGRALLLRNAPHRCFDALETVVHFATRHIVPQTMLRHLESLVFHCTIPGS